MNSTQHQSGRSLRVIAATALIVALGTLPAAARQDPGPAAPPQAHDTSSCALQRVGTQYVACDNLTGNGVPAPAWVEER